MACAGLGGEGRSAEGGVAKGCDVRPRLQSVTSGRDVTLQPRRPGREGPHGLLQACPVLIALFLLLIVCVINTSSSSSCFVLPRPLPSAGEGLGKRDENKQKPSLGVPTLSVNHTEVLLSTSPKSKSFSPCQERELKNTFRHCSSQENNTKPRAIHYSTQYVLKKLFPLAGSFSLTAL